MEDCHRIPCQRTEQAATGLGIDDSLFEHRKTDINELTDDGLAQFQNLDFCHQNRYLQTGVCYLGYGGVKIVWGEREKA